MFHFQTLSLPVLLAAFALAAAFVWVAGIWLSNSTDILDDRFHLGEALGGVILLAITTNLPEIAITASAALHHSLGIAIGNILGGIGIQTVVLVLLDVFGLRRRGALTHEAASLTLVLEGVLVVATLIVAMMGTQMPRSLIFLRMTPEDWAIVVLWVAGVWLISKARKGLPWQQKGDAPGGQKTGDMANKKKRQEKKDKTGTGRTILVFLAGAVITLAAGVVLEESGNVIAEHIHLSGVLFGATVLAAATSLPELSTGLASVKMGDYQLAVSDIFGGNAFLPTLFLLATLLSGQAALPQAQKTDIYLAGLGILLTTIYLYGLIFRPKRQWLNMGLDSLMVLVLYLLGIGGLFAIAHR